MNEVSSGPMSTPGIVDRTLAALELEETGDDRFVAHPGGGRHRLFGGLVAAQTVVAAGRTIDAKRNLHSLHAYFLRIGKPGVPIDLEVTRLRDGGSYSVRQITARQNGEAILEATASFARDEEGLEVQTTEMPEVPGPEGLPDREQERSRIYRERLGVDMRAYDSAVEVRPCDPTVLEPDGGRLPSQENWLRLKSGIGDSQLLHRAMLAYAGDRTLLSTARMPYEVGRHQLMSVSLDYTLWIHRDIDLCDWHLCQCHSPVSNSGRGMLLAQLYRADGVCVATIAQEGLVRVRRKPVSQ